MADIAIDPDIARFIATLNADWGRHPPVSTLSYPDARRVAEQVRERWCAGGPEMAQTVEHHVALPHGDMRVRIYYPHRETAIPALVYLHGGGFTFFSIDTHDRLMREYAAHGGFVVIGVDYPLSPEARYPIALEQVSALVGQLATDGSWIGIDPSHLAIGGDSAGANLALATCLQRRDTGRAPLRAMLLNYGAFTGRCSDVAEARFGGPGSVMDRAEVEYYFDNYLPDRALWNDPLACPAETEFHDLPPAFFVIPEADILTEQSLSVRDAMIKAGGSVQANIYPGATHSFLEAMSISAVARQAIRESADWVSTALKSR